MKNNFYYTLAISAGIHLLFAFSLPTPQSKPVEIQKDPKTEFIKEKIEEKEFAPRPIKMLEPIDPPPYLNVKKKLATLEKTVSRNVVQKKIEPQIKPKPEPAEEGYTDDLTIKSVEQTPAYMNYYEMIRAKIRNNAFKFYNKRDRGKVKILFSVSKTGELGDVSVLVDDSSHSRYLKQVALKSIYKSLPFPEFPDELQKYAMLKFNISIHFRSK